MKVPFKKPDSTSAHYKGDLIEPIDVIWAWKLNFFEGCVIKYLYRYRKKRGAKRASDLQKLVNYVKWIQEIEENSKKD